ncbi:hypothetical protein FIBSPDRAFT_953457 [Athelia psychrophila]|uniref:Uncharacterized protein n=1 Tax=Athelia psychrophila TaxID=1759441 RepID=A0A166KAB3_9AGAM|nr:hypothetical protein FIBSPDRAFT_953457 [Fibularhizoctonia sp. CBS 109695]
MAQIDDPLTTVLESWRNPPIFSDLPGENVGMWLSKIRFGCKMRGIPRQLWTDIAISFISGELKDVVLGRQRLSQTEAGRSQWEWESFQVDLTRICEEAERNRNIAIEENDSRSGLEKFSHEHPHLATSAGIALIGTGAVVVAPTWTLFALSWVGFGPAGPVAGSLAPVLQSTIYGGATTGIFSVFQSFAMRTVAASPVALKIAYVAIQKGVWFIKQAAKSSTPPPTLRDAPPPHAR